MAIKINNNKPIVCLLNYYPFEWILGFCYFHIELFLCKPRCTDRRIVHMAKSELKEILNRSIAYVIYVVHFRFPW